MPLTSDLQINAQKFSPKGISKQTNEFNDGLRKIMDGVPKWWEVTLPVQYLVCITNIHTYLRLAQRTIEKCEPTAKPPYQLQ